ncbi:putative glutathione peroxidase 7, chloroplastic [Drosera capensis]
MAAASHTFPTTLFTSPLRSLSHLKPKLGSNPIWVSSSSRAFVPLSSKISFGGRGYSGKVYASAVTEKSIHDFTVKDIDGKDVSLSKFKGKGLKSWLSHVTNLVAKNHVQIREIKQFACTRFKAEFPVFYKIEVNGPNTAPVYQFLKSSAGGFLGDFIKWNFEKFLVNKDGKKDIQMALAAA